MAGVDNPNRLFPTLVHQKEGVNGLDGRSWNRSTLPIDVCGHRASRESRRCGIRKYYRVAALTVVSQAMSVNKPNRSSYPETWK